MVYTSSHVLCYSPKFSIHSVSRIRSETPIVFDAPMTHSLQPFLPCSRCIRSLPFIVLQRNNHLPLSEPLPARREAPRCPSICTIACTPCTMHSMQQGRPRSGDRRVSGPPSDRRPALGPTLHRPSVFACSRSAPLHELRLASVRRACCGLRRRSTS